MIGYIGLFGERKSTDGFVCSLHSSRLQLGCASSGISAQQKDGPIHQDLRCELGVRERLMLSRPDCPPL